MSSETCSPHPSKLISKGLKEAFANSIEFTKVMNHQPCNLIPSLRLLSSRADSYSSSISSNGESIL